MFVLIFDKSNLEFHTHVLRAQCNQQQT